MNQPILNQIDQYLTCCKDIGLSPETIKTKYYVLTLFARQISVNDMRDFNNKHLTEWLKSMLDKPITERVSESTRRKYQKEIITFVKFLREDKICDPPIKLSRVRLIKRRTDDAPVFYTHQQIEYVVRYATSKEELMIRLMFDTGMRLSEFRNVRVEDIDLIRRTISVIGKGSKPGRVYFTYRTGFLLRKYILDNELSPDEFLWASQRNDNNPYVSSRLRDLLKAPFLRAGYKEFHPHALRHSFATDLIKRGATLQETQHLLRHSDSRITELYIHNLHNRLNLTYDRIKNTPEANPYLSLIAQKTPEEKQKTYV